VVTDRQVLALWKEFDKSKLIKISALKTGMDRKTASKYLKQSTLPSELSTERNWRTCEDKLQAIWPHAEEFLKESPDIEAKALFEHLMEAHPDKLEELQLRTFQRRIKQWRIKHGDNQEVFFDQITTPGKLAQLDWLDMNKHQIEINGEIYKHKLIHFTLNHSNIESVTICRSESILSIKKGLRDFLYRVVGKAPVILQVDNSSAATHRPEKNKKDRVFNEEYLQILNYYGIKAQKNNVGKPNENGVVESQNGHLKNKIKQALLIRGSNNFGSNGEYELFINNIIDKANVKRKEKFQEELPFLNEIPTGPLPEYQEEYITIRNRSTVNIKKVTYSVPSRLIGSKLKAKIFECQIDLFSGVDLVHSMPRVLGDRGLVIDYRHIIHSLIKKPGAFESYKYREELYPTENFKKAFDHLNKNKNERQATIEYLRILKLAADNFESDVDIAIGLILSEESLLLDIDSITNLILTKTKSEIDAIDLIPNLNIYDEMFLNKGDENNEDHC
jgi:transposase